MYTVHRRASQRLDASHHRAGRDPDRISRGAAGRDSRASPDAEKDDKTDRQAGHCRSMSTLASTILRLVLSSAFLPFLLSVDRRCFCSAVCVLLPFTDAFGELCCCRCLFHHGVVMVAVCVRTRMCVMGSSQAINLVDRPVVVVTLLRGRRVDYECLFVETRNHHTLDICVSKCIYIYTRGISCVLCVTFRICAVEGHHGRYILRPSSIILLEKVGGHAGKDAHTYIHTYAPAPGYTLGRLVHNLAATVHNLAPVELPVHPHLFCCLC